MTNDPATVAAGRKKRFTYPPSTLGPQIKPFEQAFSGFAMIRSHLERETDEQ